MNDKYCINCGNKLIPGNKFCANCGTEVSMLENSSQNSTANNMSAPPTRGNVSPTPPARGNVPPAPPARGNVPPAPPTRGNVPPAPPTRGNVPPAPPTRGNVPPIPPARGNVPPAPPIRTNIQPTPPMRDNQPPTRPVSENVTSPPPSNQMSQYNNQQYYNNTPNPTPQNMTKKSGVKNLIIAIFIIVFIGSGIFVGYKYIFKGDNNIFNTSSEKGSNNTTSNANNNNANSQVKNNSKKETNTPIIEELTGKWKCTITYSDSTTEDLGEALLFFDHLDPNSASLMFFDDIENYIFEGQYSNQRLVIGLSEESDGGKLSAKIEAEIDPGNIGFMEGEVTTFIDGKVDLTGKFHAEKVKLFEHDMLDTDGVDGLESISDLEVAEYIVTDYLTNLLYNDISLALGYISPEYYKKHGYHLFSKDISEYFYDFNIISADEDETGIWVKVEEDWNSGPEIIYYHVAESGENNWLLIDDEKYQ